MEKWFLKEWADKHAKKCEDFDRIYKPNFKNSNLEELEKRKTKDYIESNKVLTFKEMLERNLHIEDNKENFKFQDLSNFSYDINDQSKMLKNVIADNLKQMEQTQAPVEQAPVEQAPVEVVNNETKD